MTYDRSLLMHEVTGIGVDWMERYGNSPRIQLQGPCTDHNIRHAWWQAAQWTQHPLNDSSIWLTTHPNGFARYLTHDGSEKNAGGFGGGAYVLDLKGGGQVTLRGPWSSRATCVNMVVPIEDHIMDTDQGAIRIDAFLELCREYHFPHFIVRARQTGIEPHPVQISTTPDGVVKPSGMSVGYADAAYDVLYSPEEQR